jgi:hypothetical protein
VSFGPPCVGDQPRGNTWLRGKGKSLCVISDFFGVGRRLWQRAGAPFRFVPGEEAGGTGGDRGRGGDLGEVQGAALDGDAVDEAGQVGDTGQIIPVIAPEAGTPAAARGWGSNCAARGAGPV